MNISDILGLLGKNGTVEIATVLALLEGQAVTVPVQPLKQPLGGKTLSLALAANGIVLQYS